VCKTIGGGSNYFDVQFCLGALGSDARSAGADMEDAFVRGNAPSPVKTEDDSLMLYGEEAFIRIILQYGE
jgi:hypothetical protein